MLPSTVTESHWKKGERARDMWNHASINSCAKTEKCYLQLWNEAGIHLEVLRLWPLHKRSSCKFETHDLRMILHLKLHLPLPPKANLGYNLTYSEHWFHDQRWHHDQKLTMVNLDLHPSVVWSVTLVRLRSSTATSKTHKKLSRNFGSATTWPSEEEEIRSATINWYVLYYWS